MRPSTESIKCSLAKTLLCTWKPLMRLLPHVQTQVCLLIVHTSACSMYYYTVQYYGMKSSARARGCCFRLQYMGGSSEGQGATAPHPRALA